MNLGMMRRREIKKITDVYDSCVIFSFNLTSISTLTVTANNNNVTNYLEKLIIDGIEYPVEKNYSHTFNNGSHKIGWKLNTTIIYLNIIPSLQTTGDVYIPANITEIKDGTIQQPLVTRSLNKAYCYAAIPPIMTNGNSIYLWYPNGTRSISIPKGSRNAYLAATGWKKYPSALKDLL